MLISPVLSYHNISFFFGLFFKSYTVIDIDQARWKEDDGDSSGDHSYTLHEEGVSPRDVKADQVASAAISYHEA